MDRNQQELRRAAEKAFMESLNQLEMNLAAADEGVSPVISTSTQDSSEPLLDIQNVQAFEEAAADIEEFIKAQETND